MNMTFRQILRHSPMIGIALMLGLVVFAFTGCALADRGIDTATEKGSVALAQAVEGECRRSLERRKQTYRVYLAEQGKVGGVGKMLPFDCDGDGKPDF